MCTHPACHAVEGVLKKRRRLATGPGLFGLRTNQELPFEGSVREGQGGSGLVTHWPGFGLHALDGAGKERGGAAAQPFARSLGRPRPSRHMLRAETCLGPRGGRVVPWGKGWRLAFLAKSS